MDILTSRRSQRRRWARFLGTGGTVMVAATALASTAGAATPPNPPGGASGSVAAVAASSMEVQSQSSGQTTVNWTASTQFSKTVSETISSLATGDCVTVTGTASKKSKTTIAARSISVGTPTASGTCTGPGARTTLNGAGGPPSGSGFAFGTRGGGFFRGGEGSGTRPKVPGGSAGGNFRTLLGSLTVASGKVTAINGSTVTVAGIALSPSSFPRQRASTSKSSTKKAAAPKTQTLKITASSSTPVSATQTVAAGAVAVGDCVSAFGPAATNGSITASTVRITSTGGGTCTSGFGRFGSGGPPAFGGGPGGSGA